MITSEGVFSNRRLSCRGRNATTQDQRPLAGQKWIDDDRLSTDDGDEVAGLPRRPNGQYHPRYSQRVRSDVEKATKSVSSTCWRLLSGKDRARRIAIDTSTSNSSTAKSCYARNAPVCKNCAHRVFNGPGPEGVNFQPS